MTKNPVYCKNFSKISNIQESEVIVYNKLLTSPDDIEFYGIEITSNISGEKFVVRRLSDREKDVMDILTFLYENSVRVNDCKSILEDVLKLYQPEL